MAGLKASLILLVFMVSVKSNQAQHAGSLSTQANISMADAVAGASNAKHWMQMQNAGRTSGSGCSGEECVAACDQEWEKNGDQCYLWNSEKKNWTDAEDFCQKEGGHLASVHSDAAVDFVLRGMARLGLDIAWLGGNDIEVEGAWQWTDCTPWNFTFWASAQPSGDGHCLTQVLNHPGSHLNGKWNDISAAWKHGFLCSRKICSGVEATGATAAAAAGAEGAGAPLLHFLMTLGSFFGLTLGASSVWNICQELYKLVQVGGRVKGEGVLRRSADVLALGLSTTVRQARIREAEGLAAEQRILNSLAQGRRGSRANVNSVKQSALDITEDEIIFGQSLVNIL